MAFAGFIAAMAIYSAKSPDKAGDKQRKSTRLELRKGKQKPAVGAC
jgi:hypothetical protein